MLLPLPRATVENTAVCSKSLAKASVIILMRKQSWDILVYAICCFSDFLKSRVELFED